ncbi:MAG TPA: hypothetical protein VGC13_21370 [Longimicrobium sp.]|jgi:hypothetical protein|uniref:hypothetical protein n=1 Tax=Longimicrobium sp. TaxID=2029185 RepID=UPI002ED7FB4A
MRKIKLSLDSLQVQGFTTSQAPAGRGTVLGHEPTRGHNVGCGSAYDACQTGLCTYDCDPTYSPDACPTAYPEYC